MSQDSEIIKDLAGRGLIQQQTATDELVQHLQAGSRSLYCGFDPTADSLHIGSLVPLIGLRRFQKVGHRPIALMGGGTGLIGDPSGKGEERNLSTLDVVGDWGVKIQRQMEVFLDFGSSPEQAKLVNNLDWLGCAGLLDSLRDIGKCFSVNSMIQKESVRQRIDREGEGITFTEFSYMMLQAMDFLELNRREGCTLQIGGSDQWGNITAGIDLARRKGCGQLYGVTLPLVTKSDGTKFGKTESGTVWLDPKKTSPYMFYQFWLNVADADVFRFLKLFTFLPVAEIDAIAASDKACQGRPEGQSILAREVTQLVHGEQGFLSAKRITAALFGSDIDSLTENDFQQLELDGAPGASINEGDGLLDVLVNSGLAGSKRNAREFVGSGAVRLNGQQVKDEQYKFNKKEFKYGKYCLAKRGKKSLCLLTLQLAK